MKDRRDLRHGGPVESYLAVRSLKSHGVSVAPSQDAGEKPLPVHGGEKFDLDLRSRHPGEMLVAGQRPLDFREHGPEHNGDHGPDPDHPVQAAVPGGDGEALRDPPAGAPEGLRSGAGDFHQCDSV